MDAQLSPKKPLLNFRNGSDVLSRHEFIHKAPSRASTGAHLDASRQSRQLRACVPCAQARDRCTRDLPCERCSLRSIRCVYIDSGTAKTAKSSARGRKDEGRTRDLPEPGSLLNPNQSEEVTDAACASSSLLIEHDDFSYGQNSLSGVGGMDTVTPADMDAPNSRPNHSELSASADTRVTTFVDPDFTLMSSRGAQFQPNPSLGLNWLPISGETNIQFSSILDLSLLPDITTSGPMTADLDFPTASFLEEGGASRGDQIRAMQHSTWSPGTTSSGSRKSLGCRKSDATPPGRLYATSSSARAPTFLRDKALVPVILSSHPQLSISRTKPQLLNRSEDTSVQQFSPCDLHELVPSASLDKETPELILPATYDILVQEFRNLCFNHSDKDHQAFKEEQFPSILQVDMLLHLFHDKFIPALPISHHITRNVNEFWLLTLAMVAIGCQYTRTQEFESMVAPLHEFLRRGLQREMNLSQDDPQAQLHYLKALFLSQISCFYYGDVAMRRHALIHRGLLVQLAETLGLFAAETRPPHDESDATDNNAHSQWQQWIQLETNRRLGYSIWVSIHPSVRSYVPTNWSRCLI